MKKLILILIIFSQIASCQAIQSSDSFSGSRGKMYSSSGSLEGKYVNKNNKTYIYNSYGQKQGYYRTSGSKTKYYGR